MVYLKYVENVIPLSKLIGLLFSFCLSLLSILFLKTKINDLARPAMGSIFLDGRAKGAPNWGVQSRFRVIYRYNVIVINQKREIYKSRDTKAKHEGEAREPRVYISRLATVLSRAEG